LQCVKPIFRVFYTKTNAVGAYRNFQPSLEQMAHNKELTQPDIRNSPTHGNEAESRKITPLVIKNQKINPKTQFYSVRTAPKQIKSIQIK
jgi:hypothetical protein